MVNNLLGPRFGSYAYDSNGNMIHDGANNLDITYNYLNLIEKVEQNGTLLAEYSYLSNGTKLSATDAMGNGLVYAGSLVYRKQGKNQTLENASFVGGRFIAMSNGLQPQYYLTDHLGSVRVVTDAVGNVVERNDYYPYGMRWDAGRISYNRYHYNGKEDQSFVGVPYTDYGARMYDSRIGRLITTDKFSEKYYASSPFAYCLNNPVNAIDPDGNLVIFINGFTLSQGASNYVRPGSKYYGNSWRGTRDYWKISDDFDYKVMRQLNDYNAIYRSGMRTSNNILSASNRYDAGYHQGTFDRANIINRLARDKQGNIVEKIKVITHSMGAAYAKGYVTALSLYLDQLGLSRDIIAFEADFAPYQPAKQDAVEGIPTFQFSHTKDPLAGNEKMRETIQINTSND